MKYKLKQFAMTKQIRILSSFEQLLLVMIFQYIGVTCVSVYNSYDIDQMKFRSQKYISWQKPSVISNKSNLIVGWFRVERMFIVYSLVESVEILV